MNNNDGSNQLEGLTGSNFTKTHPIEFALFDQDNHYAIYIDDDPAGQPLAFEIHNISERDIIFKNQERAAASATNYHFELQFRKGVLSTNTLGRLQAAQSQAGVFESSDNWDLFVPAEQRASDHISMYLLHTGEATWTANSRRKLRFTGINADASGGARGTQVVMLPNQLTFSGSEAPITGKRTQYLSIINHRGRKELPLHVGFKGSNQILNIDSAQTTLTLQLANIVRLAQDHSDIPSIALSASGGDTPGTRFILEADVQTQGEEKGWALAKASELDLTITPKLIRRVPSNNDKPARFNVVVNRESISPQWLLTLQEDLILEPGDMLEVEISGIRSSLPTGPANLYLHYDHIDGFQQGRYVLPVMKSPLRFLPNTAGPLTPNQIQGSVDVHADIRAGNSDLYFTKTDHNHTGIGNTPGFAAIENAASHNTLMIMGRAGTDKGRKVSVWDYLEVNGVAEVKSGLYAGNSDLYFSHTTHNHTAIGNTPGYAAIENAANYDALMILGRAGTDKGRKVRLWDYLEVNGNMGVTGTLETNGLNIKGTSTAQGRLDIKKEVLLEPTSEIQVNYPTMAWFNRTFASFEPNYAGDVARTRVHLFAPNNYYTKIPALTLAANYGQGSNVGIANTEPPQRLTVSGGNIQIDPNAVMGWNPNDRFSFDGKNMGHYSLGWFNDSWNRDGSTAWLSGWAGIKFFSGGQPRMWMDMGGNISYVGNLARASSREIKREIETLRHEEALRTLDALRPVSYRLKADATEQRHIGFIAEEAPPLVQSHDNQGIVHDNIVVVLTQVVKAQQAQILALEKKLADLR